MRCCCRKGHSKVAHFVVSRDPDVQLPTQVHHLMDTASDLSLILRGAVHVICWQVPELSLQPFKEEDELAVFTQQGSTVDNLTESEGTHGSVADLEAWILNWKRRHES